MYSHLNLNPYIEFDTSSQDGQGAYYSFETMCPCIGWDSYDETKAKTDCYRSGNVQTFNVESETNTALGTSTSQAGTAMLTANLNKFTAENGEYFAFYFEHSDKTKFKEFRGIHNFDK